MKKRIIIIIVTLILVALIVVGVILILDKQGNEKQPDEYKIHLTMKSQSEFLCNARISFCMPDNLDNVKLMLYPNAYTAEYVSKIDGGKGHGALTVLRVEQQQRLRHSLSEDEQILTVYFDKKQKKGKRVNFDIIFNLLLPNAPTRYGHTQRAVNLGNFYPILCVYDAGEYVTNRYSSYGEAFYSKVATYALTINLDSKYTVATSGVLEKEQMLSQRKIYHFSGKNLRDFALVISDGFRLLEKEQNGVFIRYYYLDDPNPNKGLDTAVQAISLFSQLFGKYPYPCYSVVQTDFYEGGMEYPCLSYLSSAVKGQSYEEIIVHETAHQWWYNMVGNNSYKEGYLDESLAVFSTQLYYENKQDFVYGQNVLSAYKRYYDLASQIQPQIVSTLTELDSYNTSADYYANTYLYGCVMWQTLDSFMGREQLLDCLKQYFAQNCYGISNTQSLVGVLSISGNIEGTIINNFLSGRVVIL